jgi:hypothetical protein
MASCRATRRGGGNTAIIILKMFRSAVQNSVAWATRLPKVLHLCSKLGVFHFVAPWPAVGRCMWKLPRGTAIGRMLEVQ